jgi:hypothetical protein
MHSFIMLSCRVKNGYKKAGQKTATKQVYTERLPKRGEPALT